MEEEEEEEKGIHKQSYVSWVPNTPANHVPVSDSLLPDLNQSLWDQQDEFSSVQPVMKEVSNFTTTSSPPPQEVSSVLSVAPSSPKLSTITNAAPYQGNEESIVYTENIIDINRLASSNNSNKSKSLKSNLKRRKEDGLDLDKRPRKKPKKKIHRPKVVGEGKPKRPLEPKTPKRTAAASSKQRASLKSDTPKPATPKRVPSKKDMSSKRKNKRNLKDLITVSACRSLNFETERHIEDQSTSIVVIPPEAVTSGVLVFESSRDCNQMVNNEAEVSLGDNVMNQTGCQSNSVQVSQNTFSLDRSSQCLDESSIKLWPQFPILCKKKRIMKRMKRLEVGNSSKVMDPPQTTETQTQAQLELQSIFVIKKKRTKLTCIPRKNLAIFTESLPLSELACERQESKSLQRPETKNDAASGNEGMARETQTKLGPSCVKLDIHHGFEEGLMAERSIPPVFSSNFHGDLIEGCKEGVIGEMPTLTVPFFFSSELLSSPSEDAMRHQIISLFAEFQVPTHQERLEEDQNGNVQHYEHGTRVVEGGSQEKSQTEDANALVPHIENGALVPLQGGELSLVKKSRKQVMLDLHSEEIKVWKLQLKDMNEEKVDEENEGRWEYERRIFHGRIDSFTARMHIILGNRQFSPWKGSVMDSVIGVFLTQNVGDNLSSSAYMSLAAKFPPRSSNHKDEENVVEGQESIGRNTKFIALANSLVSPQLLASQATKDTSNIGNAPLKTQETILVGPHSTLVSDCNVEADSETDQKTSKMRDQTKKNVDKKMKENEIDWDEYRRKYGKNNVEEKNKQNETDWDELRRKYCGDGQRNSDHKDSVDWEAVRHAEPHEIADAIKGRGQHNILAVRIKELLDRVVKLHKDLDLEWLRHAPPEKVKKYLLEFHGLGLKSVECIRLLALRHVAFPVDTNVGRIAIRLGWVPLEPLPEQLQIHLLQQYPIMDSIQKYLWPRLQTLDQQTLYELHYQLITFGKVYCTKRNPNCNFCPMRGDCRHFASAYASTRRALPRPEKKVKSSSTAPIVAVNNSGLAINPVPSSLLQDNPFSGSIYQRRNCEPIIEEPPSPERGRPETELRDIEDYFTEDEDDIPTIRLSNRNITNILELCSDMKNMRLEDNEVSTALVALTSEAASNPLPKLKHVSRLRTKHLVYELPDSHPLLKGFDKRDSDDPCPYLLAIWTPGENANSFQPSACSCPREESDNRILGTILIPCRTANKGSFPLNGTYFQVNEVFADHESSENPINVPTSWIWKLPRRTTYFGTSTSAILRGLSTEEIRYCFWAGFVCVRAFDRKTRNPKRLAPRFHISTSQSGKSKRGTMEDE